MISASVLILGGMLTVFIPVGIWWLAIGRALSLSALNQGADDGR